MRSDFQEIDQFTGNPPKGNNRYNTEQSIASAWVRTSALFMSAMYTVRDVPIIVDPAHR